MYKIENIHEIHLLIKDIRDLRQDFLTNYYPDPIKTGLWVDNDLLYAEHFHQTNFILRKDTNFFHLYYCSSSTNDLSAGLTSLLNRPEKILYTIDLLGNKTDAAEIGGRIGSAGFFPYTSLIRMSRVTLDSDKSRLTDNPYLTEAVSNDSDEISGLLHQFFDPLAENLPLLSEIDSWINSGQVLVFKEANTIQGFLIYEITGVTSYLRYWFVHPAHREKKIGSALIQEFFARSSGTKRQLFWVIQSNENAIKRYHHYGFLPENLVDNIYTNTNIRYGENNS
ncbi:MAG: GNAT family N-acetyltransferase [Bacteroidales bacterium]|nr:GNAT family N-acetyltransferase [Bacteroidales bacterium]